MECKEFVKKGTTIFLLVGHIREAFYFEWLENVVLALKLPTWKICVDYIILNKVS